MSTPAQWAASVSLQAHRGIPMTSKGKARYVTMSLERLERLLADAMADAYRDAAGQCDECREAISARAAEVLK